MVDQWTVDSNLFKAVWRLSEPKEERVTTITTDGTSDKIWVIIFLINVSM